MKSIFLKSSVWGSDTFASNTSRKKAIFLGRLSVSVAVINMLYIVVDICLGFLQTLPYYIMILVVSLIVLFVNRHGYLKIASILCLISLLFQLYIFTDYDISRLGNHLYLIIYVLTAFILFGYDGFLWGVLFVVLTLACFYLAYFRDLPHLVDTTPISDSDKDVYFVVNFVVALLLCSTLVTFLISINHKQELDLWDKSQQLFRANNELAATLENLKIMQQQLVNSEKMASLGQLTAGIAHEINNPLNFVSGGVQALHYVHSDIIELARSGEPFTPQQVTEKEEEIASLMKSINHGIERTTKIIYSLRTFSSPSEEISDDSSIDVKECIESSLTLLNSKLFDKHIEIVRNFQKVPNAMANNAQINQVLLNLIDNAIHALEETKTGRTLEISTGFIDGMVSIKIKDNGRGIPLELQDKIMNPFFTTKEVGRGTGLGLSISYGIIQRHQGKLEFTSQVGVGTEFCILLPKALQ